MSGYDVDTDALRDFARRADAANDDFGATALDRPAPVGDHDMAVALAHFADRWSLALKNRVLDVDTYAVCLRRSAAAFDRGEDATFNLVDQRAWADWEL